MEIPIIVEPHGGGWRARCRHPIDASATGDTRYEATQALEAILRAAISDPFPLLPLEVTPDKPWIASAGSIPDDATTDAWIDAIAEYRRQRDADDQQRYPRPHREQRMCWFIIDPKTGDYGEHVKKPSRGKKLYLHNLALDSFFDAGYAYHDFLAPYSRPSFEDIIAFIVDGETRDSFDHLPQAALVEHQKTMRDFWAAWDAGGDGYLALLGRPMLREEKYWLVEGWVRRMSVGREQFYKGKTVAREEWHFRWHHGPEREWNADCYGRLRVFSDGTADAWRMGLFGYDDEVSARQELSEARYRPWEEIENLLFDGHFLPEPPPPATFGLDDSNAPFRYERYF